MSNKTVTLPVYTVRQNLKAGSSCQCAQRYEKYTGSTEIRHPSFLICSFASASSISGLHCSFHGTTAVPCSVVALFSTESVLEGLKKHREKEEKRAEDVGRDECRV